MDIESATEADAKSKGTPPASLTPAQASRANSPSSALQGVTRPSVEATPTKGLARSAPETPSARRKARCGARSRPSTVTRDGRIGIVRARRGLGAGRQHALANLLALERGHQFGVHAAEDLDRRARGHDDAKPARRLVIRKPGLRERRHVGRSAYART